MRFNVLNTSLGNFNPLSLRTDKIALWENFVMVEWLKANLYKPSRARMYFWRNQNKQEIDLVEAGDGQFWARELKWKSSQKAKIPKLFLDT